MAIFRLDYLSCFLTVVATILVGRKMWTGLIVSGVNSLIVCVIGLHTSQYGFIPANVFCICINAFNLRAWLKVQKDPSESTTAIRRLLLKERGLSHQTQTSGSPSYDSIYRTSGRLRAQARTSTGGWHNPHCHDRSTGLAVVGEVTERAWLPKKSRRSPKTVLLWE